MSDSIAQIHGVVDALAKEPAFSVALVEARLGIELTEHPNDQGMLWYDGEIPDGPFDTVSVRLPDAVWQLQQVGFHVRDDVDLPASSGVARFENFANLKLQSSSAHEPTQTLTHEISEPPGRTVSYIFELEPTERLRTVAVRIDTE